MVRNIRKIVFGGGALLFLSLSVASVAFADLHAIYSPTGNVSLYYEKPLSISVAPLWDILGGSAVGYWLLRDGSSNYVISPRDIFRPNTYQTSLAASISPPDTYRHQMEFAPFQFEEAVFTLTRFGEPDPTQ